MADPAHPVLDQPSAATKSTEETAAMTDSSNPDESSDGGIVKSSSWWGMSNLTSYLTAPHLLEQSINSVATNVVQVSESFR